MTTLASIAAEQRPAGVFPVDLPHPAPGRYETIDAAADFAADQGDEHSMNHLRVTNEIRDLKGTRAAMLQHAADQGKKPHEGSLAEIDGQIARKERRLQMAPAAPFVDAGLTARLRNRLISHGRKLNGSTKIWTGSVPKNATVASLASEIRALQAELETVERAPIPPAEAKAKLLAGLNDAAGPRVRFRQHDIYGGRREQTKYVTDVVLDWPTESHAITPLGAGPLPALQDIETLDAKAMLLWLHRDRIAAEIEHQVDEAYSDYSGPAFTEAERRIEIKRVKEAMRAVEYQLAALVWPLIEQGDHQAIRWLYDLSPGAVLGVVEG